MPDERAVVGPGCDSTWSPAVTQEELLGWSVELFCGSREQVGDVGRPAQHGHCRAGSVGGNRDVRDPGLQRVRPHRHWEGSLASVDADEPDFGVRPPDGDAAAVGERGADLHADQGKQGRLAPVWLPPSGVPARAAVLGDAGRIVDCEQQPVVRTPQQGSAAGYGEDVAGVEVNELRRGRLGVPRQTGPYRIVVPGLTRN